MSSPPAEAASAAAPGPSLDRIVVIAGPGVTVDERTLVGICQDVERDLHVVIEVVTCGSGEELAASLRDQLERGGGVVADPGDLAGAPEVLAAAATDHPALIWVSLQAEWPGQPATPELASRCIVGRGVDGYRFALHAVAARAAWPYAIHRYGAAPEQFGQLRLPRGRGSAGWTVVLLHGGGWRDNWGLDVMERVAVDLARRGCATWNLEFRRIGREPWATWHALLDDIAAGVDHLEALASHQPLDLGRCVVLGHSSGGHLALWAAMRTCLSPGAPGAGPRVMPVLAVALAGLGELEEFAARGLDSGSAAALVGGAPDEVPERYAIASPARHPASNVPRLLVHGEAEECSDLNDLARVYERAVRAAGGEARLVELPDTRHFDFLDPGSAAWRWTARELSARAGARRETGVA